MYIVTRSPLRNSHGAQHAGEFAHFPVELLVGVGATVTRFAFKNQGRSVPHSGAHVAIEGVVDEVDFGSDKPFVERSVAVIENLVPGLVPFEVFGGDLAPESREHRPLPLPASWRNLEYGRSG